jgi:hypothetical protein
MVEQCYILYSCDGSYQPIISNYSGFSAYSFSFTAIEFVDTSVSADTCFYVLSLGEIECEITDEVIPFTSVTCDCPCYCYFIRSATETTDVTYVNCDDEIIVETIEQGLTYNICSKIYPEFDTQTQIPLKITDFCINNQCPPTLPTVKPSNECDVLTLFPLSIECLVQQPSDAESFDGSTTLIITGGTPPYTVFWEIGSYAPALINIGVGSYKATVTDYYGDFTATTTCILSAETSIVLPMCFVVENLLTSETFYVNSEPQGLLNGKPYYFLQNGIEKLGYVFWDGATELWTFCQSLECQGSAYNTLDNGSNFYPTGNTGDWVIIADSLFYITESYTGRCISPIITATTSQLCANLVVRSNNPGYLTENLLIDLNEGDEINGQPSWTSSTGQYVIYLDTGATPTQWVMTGYPFVSLVNYDTSNPPLTNWQVFGSPVVYNMLVLSGECFSAYTIDLSIVSNNALCQQQGSITVNADGGVGPYEYSINGGQTYQQSTIFNGLVPGTYYVVVRDSNLVSSTVNQVVILGTSPVLYTVSLVADYFNNTFTLTAPTLPSGVTITLNLGLSSWFNYYPTTLSPVPIYNNIATIDGTYQMTLATTYTNLLPLTGPCTSTGPANYFQINNNYSNTITLTSNQVVTGTVTNSIINDPTGKCKDALGYYDVYISSVVLNGCKCCVVALVNPVLNPAPQFP